MLIVLECFCPHTFSDVPWSAYRNCYNSGVVLPFKHQEAVLKQPELVTPCRNKWRASCNLLQLKSYEHCHQRRQLWFFILWIFYSIIHKGKWGHQHLMYSFIIHKVSCDLHCRMYECTVAPAGTLKKSWRFPGSIKSCWKWLNVLEKFTSVHHQKKKLNRTFCFWFILG